MTGLRNWTVGAGLLVAVLLLGGWFVGVQPALAAATASDASASAITAQTQVLQAKLATLARTAAKRDQLDTEQQKLLKAVPVALRANTFVRRMNELAAQDMVTIAAITPGQGQRYAEPASAAAAVAAAAATAAAAASPAPTPAATGAAVAAPVVVVPLQAVVNPSITAANFTVIPMTVSFTGSSDAPLAFVRDVQNDERLFFVSGYSAETDPTTGVITGNLTGFVYALAR